MRLESCSCCPPPHASQPNGGFMAGQPPQFAFLGASFQDEAYKLPFGPT